MAYIVKKTGTATESNTNFKGEIHVWYHGKDGYVHSVPEHCEPWKRRYWAERYIKEDKEWGEHLDKSCGGHYWDYTYEIIEQ